MINCYIITELHRRGITSSGLHKLTANPEVM